MNACIHACIRTCILVVAAVTAAVAAAPAAVAAAVAAAVPTAGGMLCHVTHSFSSAGLRAPAGSRQWDIAIVCGAGSSLFLWCNILGDVVFYPT